MHTHIELCGALKSYGGGGRVLERSGGGGGKQCLQLKTSVGKTEEAPERKLHPHQHNIASLSLFASIKQTPQNKAYI